MLPPARETYPPNRSTLTEVDRQIPAGAAKQCHRSSIWGVEMNNYPPILHQIVDESRRTIARSQQLIDESRRIREQTRQLRLTLGEFVTE